MPIARTPALQSQHWIPRVAEDEFVALLNDKKPYVLPVMGVGGAGKSSLLRRFFSYCEQQQIPVLYIDLPRLKASTALDIWLQLEVANAPQFTKTRKKLHSSYESLSAILQAYGEHANNAADLLQQQGDEQYGLVVDALKGAGKALYDFWQRAENKQHQTLLRQPEEQLIRALAADFTQAKAGVLLIDTLEQAAPQIITTRLLFKDDGDLQTPTLDSSTNLSWLDYCAGLAHFFLDQAVIFALAGRPPAIRELGQLPPALFAPTMDIPAFTTEEIAQYLEKSLPRHIASPQAADIQRLQRLTVGNPFLLERVVRLIVDWQPLWDWSEAQWQPLEDSYQRDERHGLLLYVTQRLLTHVLPDDRVFWRLALPRHAVQREQASLLFPADELGEAESGLRRLRVYEDKGVLYREQDPDVYLLHDETRAALVAWAKREGVWLDEKSATIHARLAASIAALIKEQMNWEDLEQRLALAVKKKEWKLPEFGNPMFLEIAYHSIMADQDFEQRYPGYQREAFWLAVAQSVSLSHGLKLRIATALPTLSLLQITSLIDNFTAENTVFNKILLPTTKQWLSTQSLRGDLPHNWTEDEAFLTNALQHCPQDAGLLGMLADCTYTISQDYDRVQTLFQQAIKVDPKNAKHLGLFALFMHYIRQDYDRAQTLYQQAIDAAPKHARNLGNFALFMKNIRQDYDRAQTLFQQAIDADPKHANSLGNFAYFLWQIRQDYDRAQTLYQQAIEADPKHAHILGNFALFMENIRQDYDRAQRLYQQAIDADPKHAIHLGNFALFMENIRQDYDRAQTLYQQAIDADPKHARNLGNFALFMKNIRQDYDRAQRLYQQAIDADPKDADNLGNFASFLCQIRQDYDRAQTLYQQAIEVDSKDANIYANYAQLKLIQGEPQQGKNLLEKAFALEPEDAALKLELWFYAFAHFPDDYPQAETELRALLDSGARSAGWDFSGNLAQAARAGHPKLVVLKQYAAQISSDAANNFTP